MLLARHCSQPLRAGAGDRLRQIEKRCVLALAEILRTKELRQADDARAGTRRSSVTAHVMFSRYLVISALALAVVLEFAPIGAGFIVAGRSGASLGAELGSMRLTEQIHALEVLGLPLILGPPAHIDFYASYLYKTWTSGVLPDPPSVSAGAVLLLVVVSILLLIRMRLLGSEQRFVVTTTRGGGAYHEN